MSKHILLTVFFFSSFSIYTMEFPCSSMTQIRDETSASTMQLQVSNHSEHIATFFSTVGASKLCAPRVLASYEDSGPVAVMRKGKTYLNTFAGSFLLMQPKKDNPHKALILHSLKALQKDDKWSTDKVEVQRMPYEQSHNVIAIVNPSGDIQLAQHHDAQDLIIKNNLTSEEKISAQEMLHKAILRDSVEEIKAAIEAGADINQLKDGKTPVWLATILSKRNSLRALIEHQCNINTTYMGASLLQQTMRMKEVESAILLLKKGISFEGKINDKNIMDVAISFFQNRPRSEVNGEWVPLNKLLELVQTLIDCGWDIDNNNAGNVGDSLSKKLTNVWWESIAHGYQGLEKELLNLFIKNNADPNQTIYYPGYGKGGWTWTPLILAVERYNQMAAKTLLDAGADINKKARPFHDRSGRDHSPLSYAVARGDQSMISFLSENGAK